MSIKNLNQKLNGELPVTREELVKLINSWGRHSDFYINKNEYRIVRECKAKECYDLSKLDTSEITDMSNIFRNSNFNGDISNWNTSNVTDMDYMFYNAQKFNQPLNFDTSNVRNMKTMFFNAKSFNQPLNFDTSKVTSMEAMFCNAIAFETKFNNGQVLPNNINYLKRWFNNNIDKMLEIERLNKESTPEHKIAIVENKINNNKTTLDDLFREKNIDPNSKIGLELLKVYNDTHDKLKLELEDLKTQVIDIATNDFNSI